MVIARTSRFADGFHEPLANGDSESCEINDFSQG